MIDTSQLLKQLMFSRQNVYFLIYNLDHNRGYSTVKKALSCTLSQLLR